MAQVTHFQRRASHDDLVERARQLVPHLRQRVKEMDQLGYLPEATVQELQDAELFQLTTPRIYGGHQVDVRTFLDVIAEMGRGDASTAWNVGIINGANWMAATIFPEETQQEVFGTEGGARVTGVLAPRQCSVQRVDDGYLIKEGKWGFNSGSYHSNWVELGIPLLNERGEVVDQGLALLPAQDVERLNDWNVIGMQGTGSTSVAVQNKFVPDRRITSMHLCHCWRSCWISRSSALFALCWICFSNDSPREAFNIPGTPSKLKQRSPTSRSLRPRRRSMRLNCSLSVP